MSFENVGPRATENIRSFPPFIDLEAASVIVRPDHSTKKVNFGVVVYNGGNITITTPFRVDISVTQTTFSGQFIVNSVTMNPVAPPIPPYSLIEVFGNIDNLKYAEDNVRYEIECLVDPEYQVSDTYRSNNYIKIPWWTVRPNTLKKLPARFENKK